MSLTFSIATLGCKVNQVDSAVIGRDLEKLGYEPADFGQAVDVTIVNTCAVTVRADKQGRQLVTKARAASPKGLILVTGCSPMTSENRPDAYLKADIICGNEEKPTIPELLENARKSRKRIIRVETKIRSEKVKSADPVPVPGRTRAFSKVQDGCSFSCAYCIVPAARGPSRSVSRERATRQYGSFVEAGFKEIVLTGIHLGCWGQDLEPTQKLWSLVETLVERYPDSRLRLSSIEPPEVENELVELMNKYSNLCRHLHIPMQSGSDAILAAMNRQYDSDTFTRLVENIRSICPETTIGTDVIVGFPGETDRDHRQTVRLIESLPLSHLHVFPFSARPNTPAANMSNHVDPKTMKQRAAEIRELGLEKKKEHYAKFEGKILEVITEWKFADDSFGGLSDNYIPVFFEQNSAIGTLTDIKIEKSILRDNQPALFGHITK